MPQTSILYPAFAHVLLTIAVLIIMGIRRSASMKARKHGFKDVALGQDVWAEAATKAARNYSNQFEMPVLFHAACAMALAAKAVDTTFIFLAWAFVAARVVHAINPGLGRKGFPDIADRGHARLQIGLFGAAKRIGRLLLVKARSGVGLVGAVGFGHYG